MKLFNLISQELDAYDKRRELVIRASRDILKEAKRIIFFCHEDNLTEAAKRLAILNKAISNAEDKFRKPLPNTKQSFSLYNEGSWNAACEEYLEAWFLYNAITKHQIVEPKGITPSADIYVGALADCTGELVRLSVILGSDKKIKEIEKLRKLVADIVAFMLPLYLTGQSRQKFDQAKRNLKRIEEILYEVKIRG